MTYNEFIQNILDTRGRFNIPDGEYKERHHIVPKSVGGTNDEENLIDLYAKEHFIAHRLLALENPDNSSFIRAWYLMSHLKNDKEERYECTPEEYEEAKIAFVSLMREAMSGENNPMFGHSFTPYEMTEEIKQKISNSLKGRMSEERMGEGNPFYGKHHSEETKRVFSEQRKRGKHPKAKRVVCDGVIYDCIVDCAEFYDVPYHTMKHWLDPNYPNKIPQRFVELGLKVLSKGE